MTWPNGLRHQSDTLETKVYTWVRFLPSQQKNIFMKNKDKGELVEQIVITEFMKLGIPVSKPIGDNQPYDIIIDLNGKLLKIQVRTCWRGENMNSLKIPFMNSRMNAKIAYKTTSKDKIDYYVAYSFDTGKCYLINVTETDNTNCIYLQLNEKCKNGGKLNYAKNFELNINRLK